VKDVIGYSRIGIEDLIGSNTRRKKFSFVRFSLKIFLVHLNVLSTYMDQVSERKKFDERPKMLSFSCRVTR
jgi:hypothetical protein